MKWGFPEFSLPTFQKKYWQNDSVFVSFKRNTLNQIPIEGLVSQMLRTGDVNSRALFKMIKNNFYL